MRSTKAAWFVTHLYISIHKSEAPPAKTPGFLPAGSIACCPQALSQQQVAHHLSPGKPSLTYRRPPRAPRIRSRRRERDPRERKSLPWAGSRAAPTSRTLRWGGLAGTTGSSPGRGEASGPRQHRPGAGLTCWRAAGGGARRRAGEPQPPGGSGVGGWAVLYRTSLYPAWRGSAGLTQRGSLHPARAQLLEQMPPAVGNRARPRPFSFVSRGLFAAGEGESRPEDVRLGRWGPSQGPLAAPQVCGVTEVGKQNRCDGKMWRLISFYCPFVV